MIEMESPPQMYENTQQLSQLDLKKSALMANNNNNNSAINNNNNSATAINQNTAMVVKQQQAHHLQQGNNNNNNNNNNVPNNNTILQKHIMQQYTQSDLEELTSQEISLDLQHLIDDQFREQETLGIFTEMVSSTANGNGLLNSKVLQQNRLNQQQQQGYPRTTLAYMPQPVHTGATYTNTSSDENSSVGSDGTHIKEEPSEAHEFRRQLQSNGNGQFMNGNGNQNGIYQLPPNYVTNGNGNNFTNLTPPILHHQSLPHLPGAHISNLKHNKMLNHRKQTPKHVDKGTDEYRRRRERNNIAVRKSREKAKVRSREVEEKVKTLLKEKDALLHRLEEMNSEIQLHKQIYVHLMNHSNPEVNNICRSVLSLVTNTVDHCM